MIVERENLVARPWLGVMIKESQRNVVARPRLAVKRVIEGVKDLTGQDKEWICSDKERM